MTEIQKRQLRKFFRDNGYYLCKPNSWGFNSIGVRYSIKGIAMLVHQQNKAGDNRQFDISYQSSALEEEIRTYIETSLHRDRRQFESARQRAQQPS